MHSGRLIFEGFKAFCKIKHFHVFLSAAVFNQLLQRCHPADVLPLLPGTAAGEVNKPEIDGRIRIL